MPERHAAATQIARLQRPWSGVGGDLGHVEPKARSSEHSQPDVYRPSFDLCQNALMEVVDLVSHARRLANVLTTRKVPALPPNA